MQRLIFSVLFLFFTACASNPQPEWVEKPQEVYDESQYLTAVGQGKNQEQASQRALANLAKIFSVSIHEEQLDSSSFTTGAGKTNTEVSRHISATARNELEGAKIVETYTGENGDTFAVAVLEKAIAARNLREKIRNADKKIDDLVNYASTNAANVFSGLTALKEAHQLQKRRENDNRNLLVVANKGIPARNNSAEIEAMFRNALASLDFSVKGSEPYLAEHLSAAASNLGMDINENSPLSLSADLAKEDVFKEGGWCWQRATLTLALNEQGANTRQKRYTLKASARQEALAETRLKDKIGSKMSDYLFELLMEE